MTLRAVQENNEEQALDEKRTTLPPFIPWEKPFSSIESLVKHVLQDWYRDDKQIVTNIVHYVVACFCKFFVFGLSNLLCCVTSTL